MEEVIFLYILLVNHQTRGGGRNGALQVLFNSPLRHFMNVKWDQLNLAKHHNTILVPSCLS